MPLGWTLIGNSALDFGGNGNVEVNTYYKIADGSEGVVTPTGTFNSGHSYYGVGSVIRGVDQSNPLNLSVSGAVPVTSNHSVPNPGATTIDDCLIVGLCGYGWAPGSGPVITNSNLSNIQTQLFEDYVVGFRDTLLIFTGELASQGPIGSTQIAAGDLFALGYTLLAIAPAAAVQGDLASGLDSVALNSGGNVSTSGALSTSLADASLNSTAELRNAGQVNAALEDVSVSSSGSSRNVGNASIVIDDLVGASGGQSSTIGNLNLDVGDVLLASLAIAGSSTQELTKDAAWFSYVNHVKTATITTDSEEQSLPVTNVRDPLHFEIWRTQSTDAKLQFTWAEPQEIQAILIGFTAHRDPNSSAPNSIDISDAIRISASNVGLGQSDIHDDIVLADVNRVRGYFGYVTSQALSARFLEVTISAASRVPQGYFDVWYAHVGPLFQPGRNYNTGSNVDFPEESLASISPTGGATFTESRSRLLSFDGSWSLIDETEGQIWRDMQERTGVTVPIAFGRRANTSFAREVMIARFADSIRFSAGQSRRESARVSLIENR